jgi:hypothetical protein
MSDPYLQLTVAERDGLARYLKLTPPAFSEEIQRLIDSHSISLVRRAVPGDFVRSLIKSDNDSLAVALDRISGDQWQGLCSCSTLNDCVHCFATARAALNLTSQTEFSVPIPTRKSRSRKGSTSDSPAPTTSTSTSASQKHTSLRAFPDQVEDLIGRNLIADERSYLQRLARIFLRVKQTGVVFSDDLASLFQGSEKIPSYRHFGYSGFHPWPTAPENPVQCWQGVAHAVRDSDLAYPPFMDEVSRHFPIPQPWLDAWRSEKVQHWLKRIEHIQLDATSQSPPSPEPNPDSEPAPRTDFRLVLQSDRPVVQILAPGPSPTWSPLSNTQLKRYCEALLDGALNAVPEASLILSPVGRCVLSGWTGEFSYSGSGQFGAALARLLTQPSLRSRILNSLLQPFPYPPANASWHVEQPESAEGDYLFSLRRSDGIPLTQPFFKLPGPTSMWVTASELVRIPPIPQGFHESKVTSIPAAAVETSAGIQLIHKIGAPLTPRIDSLVQQVSLTLALSLSINSSQPGNSGRPSERLHISINAIDSDSLIIESLNSIGWTPTRKPRHASHKITLYSRNALLPAQSIINDIGARWDPVPSIWYVRITKNFPELFVNWVNSLPKDVQLALSPELQSLLDDPVSADLDIEVKPAGVDWFDLAVSVKTPDVDLTPEELQLLLNARGGYVRLGAKGWRRLAINVSPEHEEQLAQLGISPRDFSSKPQRLHALQLADSAASKLLPQEQADLILRRAEDIKASVTPPIPSAIQAELRPYQLEGFHFLAYLSENHFGGVLADDMGLGKTLQTLAWIAWLRSRPDAAKRRILIVCPKSVAPNWESEAKRFLPDLRVNVWRGERAADFKSSLAECDALVINYPQLRLVHEDVAAQPFLAAILDEAQAIKNPDSQTSQAARAIQADHRLALTGTPIENRLLDLWAILSFAMPGALGNRAQFQQSFAKATDSLSRKRLAARLRPFLLRRTKSQVAQDLPPRIEEDLVCELEGVQQSLYRAEYKKARALLLKLKTSADLDQFRFHFLTSLLRLRQICCHPALVDAAQIKQPSAKVEALLDLLEPLLSEGHKVLIFSQFTSMLDILRTTIRERGWTDFHLAGDTEDRGPLVQSFNAHDGPAVFLISLKAGGFGLNLTSASYVVLYDPWWNPAVENQAIDRTHRIGQTATVFAYRLIVKGSIEEKIRILQKEKQSLAQDILGEERFSQSLSISDLQFLFSSPEAPV